MNSLRRATPWNKVVQTGGVGKRRLSVCGSNCRCCGRLSSVTTTQQRLQVCSAKKIKIKLSRAPAAACCGCLHDFPSVASAWLGLLWHSSNATPPPSFSGVYEESKMWESTHKQVCAWNIKRFIEQRDYAVAFLCLFYHPLFPPSIHPSVLPPRRRPSLFANTSKHWSMTGCALLKSGPPSMGFQALTADFASCCCTDCVFCWFFFWRQEGKSIHPRYVLSLKYFCCEGAVTVDRPNLG